MYFSFVVLNTHSGAFFKPKSFFNFLWMLKSRLHSLHGYLEVMARFTLCPERSELKTIHRKRDSALWGSLFVGMGLVCVTQESYKFGLLCPGEI